MCKHCERLVEDIQHKQTVHDFMAVLTNGINRTLSERGMKTRVTPDEVEFYATMASKEPGVNKLPEQINPSVLKLLYKDLMDAVK